MLPLTRTCRLDDYLVCPTVESWQFRVADDARQRWLADGGSRTGSSTMCVTGAARGFLDALNAQPTKYDLVYALSVLDRIEAPVRFLREVGDALTPGGLIVCTFAVWDVLGPDIASGHQARRRIYDPYAWKKLLDEVRALGFQTFGGVDFRYHGHTIGGDHSIASLVITRGARARQRFADETVALHPDPSNAA